MKYFLCLAAFLGFCNFAYAQDGNQMLQTEVEEEYYQQENQSPEKSNIYIFFNNQPCQNCPQAIAMIEEAYNQNFLNQYNLYTIDYADDTNSGFVQMFALSNPLEVVMVQMNNGEMQGYQKIEGITDMVPDPMAFNEYFVSQVNGYLGGE